MPQPLSKRVTFLATMMGVTGIVMAALVFVATGEGCLLLIARSHKNFADWFAIIVLGFILLGLLVCIALLLKTVNRVLRRRPA